MQNKHLFSFLGIPTYGEGGRGGVKPFGPNSQLLPKICFESSPYTNARISNKFIRRHLLTKFASYKVLPVMVSINPWVCQCWVMGICSNVFFRFLVYCKHIGADCTDQKMIFKDFNTNIALMIWQIEEECRALLLILAYFIVGDETRISISI